MRAASAIVIATLTLCSGSSPVFAETECGWLYSLRMFDAQTGWAVEAEGWSGVVAKGAEEFIVRTTDGGTHWKDVTPHAPPAQKIGGPGYAYDVHWLNSSVAWVRAGTLLFRTIDGGQAWKHLTIPDYGWIYFVDPRNGWLESGRIYRSADGGETWIEIGSAKFFRQTFSITFLNTTTGWIAGFSDARDGVYHLVTRDGGHTWQQQKLPLPSEVITPGVLNIGGSHMFFNSQDGILPADYGTNKDAGFFFYVTHDGGTTWTYTTPVTLQSYRADSGILVPLDRSSSFVDTNHGWVTDGDALYMTSDGGRHWTTIQPGPPFAYAGQIDFVSTQVGWATGQGNNLNFLLKTGDGGHTWESLPCTISR